MEVSIRQISGSANTGFGFLVGLHKDKSAYKKFLITAAGQLKIDNFYNNRGHILTNYVTNAEIKKGGSGGRVPS